MRHKTRAYHTPESDSLKKRKKRVSSTEGKELAPLSNHPVLPESQAPGIGVVINEVQLLLAEKRTSLAAMRTGIAVFALPLSVLSVLVGTSRYYDPYEVMHLLLPLFILCAALVLLGGYLVIRAVIRIRRYDRLVLKIKQRYSQIAEFID